MQHTSSLSVNTTTSGRDGRRLTDPNSVSIWRQQISKRPKMTDLEFRFWQTWTKVKHIFGAHSWVPSETWTWVEDHAIVELTGFVCWRCPARRSL